MISIFLSIATLILVAFFVNQLSKTFKEYSSIQELIAYAEINKPGARKALAVLLIDFVITVFAVCVLISQ